MISKLKHYLKAAFAGHGGRHSPIGEILTLYEADMADSARVGHGSMVVHSAIGAYSYLGMRCIVAHTTIGKFCSIASDVTIGTGSHPIAKNVAMHPLFYLRREPEWNFVETDRHIEFKPTAVGNDVWIGNKVVVMDGVKIGDGAVLGAGAVVTRDVEPYGIYAGVPARLIRFRFEPKQIEQLLKLQWWDRDLQFIRDNIQQFIDIDNFLDMFSIGDGVGRKAESSDSRDRP